MTGPRNRACIIGWPVAHSRSPLIHGYWLKKYGIDGSYVKRPVQPEEAVAFLRGMRAEGLAGCNVTIPHKEAAFAVAAEKKPAARAMGAANTLWFEGDRLVGRQHRRHRLHERISSLTVPRFDAREAPLPCSAPAGRPAPSSMPFLEAGAPEVRVFNRTRARADAVAGHFGARVKPYDWSDRVDRSRDASMLVNATSLGMKGGAALDMPLAQLDEGVHRRRSRLRAAGDAAGCRRARARASATSTASACCCTRRFPALRSGSASRPR